MTCTGRSSATGETAGRWKGHRPFAIDGTKMNLPRPLAEAGYPFPRSTPTTRRGWCHACTASTPRRRSTSPCRPMPTSGPRHSPISTPCRRAMLWSSTGATSRSCFCTPCSRAACTRCFGSRARKEPPPSTASSTAARTTPSCGPSRRRLRCASSVPRFPGNGSTRWSCGWSSARREKINGSSPPR